MVRYLIGLTLLFSFNLAWASDPGVTDTEIVIGAHTAESGLMAIYAPQPRAMTAYFDMINEKGGVLGRKIRWIRIDSQGLHPKSVEATKKLVEQDKIFAMFGGHGASHQAVYKYLAERGVPDLYFSDALQEYFTPMMPTVFSAMASFSDEGRTYGELIAKEYQGKRVCFLNLDNALGIENHKGAKEAIEAANGKLDAKHKVVLGTVEKVDRSANQANIQVMKLKNDGCEVVVTSAYSALGPNVVTYATNQGFKPTWIVGQYNTSNKFFELIPAEVRDGVISSATVAVSGDFNVPGWDGYKKFLEKTGIPEGRPSAFGYAWSEVFVEVLKRAGKDLSRNSLIKAAESMNGFQCSLCLAPIITTSKDHRAFEKTVLVKSKGGKWLKM